MVIRKKNKAFCQLEFKFTHMAAVTCECALVVLSLDPLHTGCCLDFLASMWDLRIQSPYTLSLSETVAMEPFFQNCSMKFVKVSCNLNFKTLKLFIKIVLYYITFEF